MSDFQTMFMYLWAAASYGIVVGFLFGMLFLQQELQRAVACLDVPNAEQCIMEHMWPDSNNKLEKETR